MDPATIIGLLSGTALIISAIVLGGSAMIFFNVPGMLIVVGGTLAATFIKFTMSDVINSIKVVMKAFLVKSQPSEDVIREMVGVVHPCKIYGAMAVGRPILMLGPRPCHVSDILDAHDVGWQIEHGDVDGAVACIGRILETEAETLLRKGRLAQRAVAESYGRAALCRAFCDVLERGS